MMDCVKLLEKLTEDGTQIQKAMDSFASKQDDFLTTLKGIENKMQKILDLIRKGNEPCKPL